MSRQSEAEIPKTREADEVSPESVSFTPGCHLRATDVGGET